MNRRDFLTSTALAGTTLAGGWARASAVPPQRALGLQLFTVMTQLEQDFEGTLRTIAEIGYREVETIGAFGRDPHEVRALLDKHGLVSPSQHLMAGDLYGNFLRFTRHEITTEEVQHAWETEMSMSRIRLVIEEAIERARALGQSYIVLQIIWPHQMQTRAALREFCAGLDQAGGLCARAGLTFNFHNHADEFGKVNDYVPYQVILDSTNPQTVKLELDVYWAVRGGADPVDYLRRYRGRYLQCHLKDSTATGDFATVGQGVINFPRILDAARRYGVRHYYVEYDRADDPMAVTREAYTYLAKLI
jgi:sugar phosphate isomerase/epimerase